MNTPENKKESWEAVDKILEEVGADSEVIYDSLWYVNPKSIRLACEKAIAQERKRAVEEVCNSILNSCERFNLYQGELLKQFTEGNKAAYACIDEAIDNITIRFGIDLTKNEE